MHLNESYTKKEPGKSMAKIEKQSTNIKEKKFIKFRKIRKIKRKNEENKIEIKNKFEYIPCKTDKSEQSKDFLFPNIIQKENCIFNESIKFQIAKKRKSSSEVNKYQLKEMKKVHSKILRNSKKNEKVETHSKKSLKEKKEISKANKISTNKIKIKVGEEELFDYIKKGKKRAKKNYEKYMLEENCSQEKENSNNYKRKNKKFESFENEKNNKKMKFEKECEKLCINRNDIKEENIQRNYIIEFLVKCMIKLNKINIISLYVFILNLSFFIQFVECNHRKIELFSSYINLKTIGTGQIRVFSSYFDKNNYPTAIIINNRINHTNS